MYVIIHDETIVVSETLFRHDFGKLRSTIIINNVVEYDASNGTGTETFLNV